MRFIYTLLLSFTVYIGYGQSSSPDSVIITGNCYGRRIPDTTADKLTQGLSGRFICLSVPVSYSNQQIITVHDAETLQSLPGATVSFISKNGIDTIRLAADENGKAKTVLLKENTAYTIQVSSAGYKSYSLDFIHGRDVLPPFIALERDVKQCSPVVLFSTICYRKIRCGGMVRVIRDKAMPEPAAAKSVSLHIYPNPAKRGGTITLQWDDASLRPAEYRVYSLNGMLVTRQPVNDKGANGQVRVNTDSRWAAGTYFLQAVCENGRVLASGKIIIQ